LVVVAGLYGTQRAKNVAAAFSPWLAWDAEGVRELKQQFPRGLGSDIDWLFVVDDEHVMRYHIQESAKALCATQVRFQFVYHLEIC
jgi:hypothetical protein